MKRVTSFLQKPFNWTLVGLFGLLLTSCGTYQNASYSEDGIYSTGTMGVPSDNTGTQTAAANQNANSNYYKQYFGTKSAQISNISDQADIFTDIDSYTSAETVDDNGLIVIEDDQESFGPWGTNATDVTVNVYDNGWGAWGGFGFGAGWGWGPGFNRLGWGPGWGGWGGWGAWGWNYGFNPGIGFGWGPAWGPAWAFGPGWYWPAGYGWGWGNGYWNNGYAYGRGYAYNRGRRADYRGNVGYGAVAASRTAATNNRRSSYSRSEVARRVNQANARRSGNVNSRSSSNFSNSRRNTNSMSGSRNSRNMRSTSPNFNNRSRSTNFNNRSRSSGSMRSSGSRSRSSGSMRSGGSMRSSGGSMRSSGGSRGGGGRRGGRG
ncbi:hypothetical protein [Gilvibacter sediminis]|uniref:hypothetical protein n=1 Tax=Gilvibacter sediminis TaxID=379071 RepID=UPI0023503D0E|nr:hypothetical protein [Gilvibacter sediminis]MDC7999406.1 hypothetical protein [Gilvibacter sediminis]